MSTFTSKNLPAYSFASFSSSGPNCRHGPHHGAQKSTTTGNSLDFRSTSASKVCEVEFLIHGEASGMEGLCVGEVRQRSFVGSKQGRGARRKPRRMNLHGWLV